MTDDGGMLQRVILCVSISAHARSSAPATNSQFFTFPRGIPGEAKIAPESSIKTKLEALRHRRQF